MLSYIFAFLCLGLVLHVQAFFSGVGVKSHYDRCWLLHSTSPTADKVAVIRETVMGMKTGDIKKALISKGADTRGLFDKADLAALLIKLETTASVTTASVGKVTSIPMYDVPLGAATQTYVGIDLMIKGEKMRFMVDTGATMNLIRQETIQRLGLVSEQQKAYTVGLGGGGTVAAKKCTIQNVVVGDVAITMDAAILENNGALPNSAQGLLGLTFLQSLGDVVEFDFTNLQFRFGTRSALLSPSQLKDLYEIRTRRIYTGLIACDVYINDGPFPFTAMVDMGSAHTIANPLAVQAITGNTLNALPESKNMCAGIDGRPVAMRNLVINHLRIGSEVSNKGQSSIYAADIPGMNGVGLGTIPALILGMDMLGRKRLLMDINMNKIFVAK